MLQFLLLDRYIIDTPFHRSAKRNHHSMSDLASLLRRTKWLGFLTILERSISLLRKVLPGLTTLQACESTPIRDFRSLFLHSFLPRHFHSNSLRRANLSAGSLNCMAVVFISIPRNTRTVLGPSVLSGSTGVPVLSHVSSIVCRLLWHSIDLGLLAVMKSSM